jgi:hypothetical protein
MTQPDAAWPRAGWECEGARLYQGETANVRFEKS